MTRDENTAVVWNDTWYTEQRAIVEQQEAMWKAKRKRSQPTAPVATLGAKE